MTTRAEPAPGSEETGIDELELELRRLPGVRAVGLIADDELLLVRLELVGAGGGEPGEAVRIAARHSAAPVGVEIVRHTGAVDASRSPASAPTDTPQTVEVVEPDEASGASGAPDVARATGATAAAAAPAPAPAAARVRLLSVLAFPDTDEVEVHLVHGDRRTIGRGRASGGVAAVAAATVAAVRELGAAFDVQVRWARTIETDGETGSLVGVSLVVDSEDAGRVLCYGLAGSHGPMDAAARATLDALNRQLARVLPA